MANPWDNDPIVGHVGQQRGMPLGPPNAKYPLEVQGQEISNRRAVADMGNDAARLKNDEARLELERERLRLAQDEALRNSRPFSNAQVADAQQRAGFLSAVERQLGEVDRLNNSIDEEGWAGPIYGNIPGTGLDPESSQYDKATTLLTSLIRNVTRTPNEGAMSDYESKLAAATPPQRSDTPAARRQAIDDLRALLAQAKNAPEQILATTRPITTPQDINAMLGRALPGAPKTGNPRLASPPRKGGQGWWGDAPRRGGANPVIDWKDLP